MLSTKQLQTDYYVSVQNYLLGYMTVAQLRKFKITSIVTLGGIS